MKKRFLGAVLALGALVLAGCDKNDDGGGAGKVSPIVNQAFQQKFPSASKVRWETKGEYQVAGFRNGDKQASAWFDGTGNWYMTETDVRFEELPEAVRTAFAGSEYADWKRDDVDRLEREGMETVYVVEVEKGQQEADLYYTSDGVLVKTVLDAEGDDDHSDYLPVYLLSTAMTDFLTDRYPGHRLLEVDAEQGQIEVDFLYGGRCREAVFDVSGGWIHTRTEIRPSEVPSKVADALRASEYAAWTVEEVEEYVALAETYYLFELESGEREAEVKITAEGVLTVRKLES